MSTIEEPNIVDFIVDKLNNYTGNNPLNYLQQKKKLGR